jgi:hypothetical protein
MGNPEANGNGLPLGYSDANRAFLQAILSRGSLTFPEGQAILSAILTATNPDRDPILSDKITRDVFSKYIHTAHEALLPFDYDIRSAVHQRTRERVWAIINVESDPATQLATVHTPEEILYVNRLLDQMFDTHNTPRMEVMAVDENQALKVARPSRPRGEDGAEEGQTQGGDKGLRASDVLTLLENLVAEGWLEKSRARFYSLSPRSLLELRNWLVETYNDDQAEDGAWQPIKFCEFCKEIVTVGQRCDERDCVVRLHNICQEAFWEGREEKKCPKCETVWSGKHCVGERAVTGTEAYARGHRQSTGRSRRRREEAEEDGDEEE